MELHDIITSMEENANKLDEAIQKESHEETILLLELAKQQLDNSIDTLKQIR